MHSPETGESQACRRPALPVLQPCPDPLVAARDAGDGRRGDGSALGGRGYRGAGAGEETTPPGSAGRIGSDQPKPESLRVV